MASIQRREVDRVVVDKAIGEKRQVRAVVYRARYRDEGGREHARHFQRKVDAQRWLDEVTAAVVTGQYVDPKAGKATFDALFRLWVPGGHVLLSHLVQVGELGVPIGVLAALGGLGVGLQAVPQLAQQPPDHEIADPVPVLGQRPGQRAGRLRRPPQRRHRVPPGHRLDQRLQRHHQIPVVLLSPLATPTGTA